MLDANDPETLVATIGCLLDGGVVCIPTDTVYGIAASLNSLPALERIYKIKGRDASKPLPVLIDSAARLDELALPDDRRRLLNLVETFWPGALTVVLRAQSGLPGPVLGARADATMTVGIRWPDDSLAVALAQGCGGAIAVTSANRSGFEPATTAFEAANALGTDVDLIIDGGNAPGGTPSTVIDVSEGDPVLLRRGAISFDVIVKTWSESASAR